MTVTVEDYGRAQTVLWGEAGEWAHEHFAQVNRQYFANQIPARGIIWGLTPQGSLSYTDTTGRITLNPALLDAGHDFWRRGTQPYLGQGYAIDVLVHECVHSLLRSRGIPEPRDTDHNSPPWCEEVLRLSPLLGLGRVQAAPIKSTHVNGKAVTRPQEGFLSRVELATFPWGLRR